MPNGVCDWPACYGENWKRVAVANKQKSIKSTYDAATPFTRYGRRGKGAHLHSRFDVTAIDVLTMIKFHDPSFDETRCLIRVCAPCSDTMYVYAARQRNNAIFN